MPKSRDRNLRRLIKFSILKFVSKSLGHDLENLFFFSVIICTRSYTYNDVKFAGKRSGTVCKDEFSQTTLVPSQRQSSPQSENSPTTAAQHKAKTVYNRKKHRKNTFHISMIFKRDGLVDNTDDSNCSANNKSEQKMKKWR